MRFNYKNDALRVASKAWKESDVFITFLARVDVESARTDSMALLTTPGHVGKANKQTTDGWLFTIRLMAEHR